MLYWCPNSGPHAHDMREAAASPQALLRPIRRPPPPPPPLLLLPLLLLLLMMIDACRFLLSRGSAYHSVSPQRPSENVIHVHVRAAALRT